MSSEVKEVYLNDKQLKFLKSRAKRKTFHGGRGSGKTSTLGVDQYQCFWELPRATNVIGGLTYVQLDSVVLPGILASLERLNIHEYNKAQPYGVYVLGVKPPDHWGTPYQKVGKKGYQYAMTFINGYTIRFVSQDNPNTHRGINSDLIRIDESATMDEDFINTVLSPTMRANPNTKLAKSHLHHSFYDFSSASWTPEGNWIYKTEELYKEMLERRAKMTNDEKLKNPPEYLFLESTYRDNQANLPLDYGKRLQDQLSELQYMVEVENERLGKLPNCFYFAFSNKRHTYVKSYDYEYDDKAKLHLYRSNDYQSDRELEISLDFNADICWAVTCQEVGREFRVIDSQFEKSSVLQPDKNVIIENAKNWCTKYSNHEKKTVKVYGDKSGKNRSAGSGGDNGNFFSQFIKVLIDKGWNVIREYEKQGKNPDHKDKYILLNHLLEESNERAPKIRFNQNTNKVLIIAMGRTPIMTDGTFRKSKKSEISGDMVTNREYATDGTDALDYILYAKYKKFMPGVKAQQNTFDSF